MAIVDSRQKLIDYCLRKIGAPVLEINVADDQIEDRVDEAIQFYQEYHSDATYRTYLKHLVSDSDVINQFIEISPEIQFISKMFPIRSGGGMGTGMWNIKYQFYLQNMSSFAGNLAYLHQLQSYLSLIDMEFTGTPQVEFSRRQNRLYIFGDFADKDIEAGDHVVVEAYQTVNPEIHTKIYNDIWLKEYTTALIRENWGTNLLKFDGMQLPGGVTLNGRQIYEDAQADLLRLRERLRLEHETPIDFFIG